VLVHSERLVPSSTPLPTTTASPRPPFAGRYGTSTAISRPIAAPPRNNARLRCRARFDRIFKRKTGFVTLCRLLVRLDANKPELSMVRDRPEIALQTNGPENDIRCHLTRRKLSATLCQPTRQSPPRRDRVDRVSDWTLPDDCVATKAIREVI
jgi:hypothetical protein